MTMKNERENNNKDNIQVSGFSEFSKPQCSGKLINPNVQPISGFEKKSMFDSSESEGFYERLTKLNESVGYNLVFDVRHSKLNLHLFYREVTLRGGYNQVNKDKRWDEIASTLKLDGRNLNSPDILLKLYALFLFKYEQIYFYRGTEKATSMPDLMRLEYADLNIDAEDSQQMEMKSTDHSSQMITVEDGPGEKQILNESCSQPMAPGSPSAEKKIAPEAEQKQIPQPESKKSQRKKPKVPEATKAEKKQIPKLQSKKSETKKRRTTSVEKLLAVTKRKTMKPGARQGIRSAYHIFIKTECERLRKIQSNKGENLRQMANDAWNQLSEADKKPFIEQSVMEKEIKKAMKAADKDHALENACLENKQSSLQSPVRGYLMVLDASDAENSNE